MGEQASPERKRSDQVLRHLVRPVVEPMGYDVRRADDFHEEGLITYQIIQRLIDGDLVVADLTGRNANVYYELAVRHGAQKPVAHLIEHGEALPFDVANVRAIPFSLTDPDLLAGAKDDLAKKIAAIESAAGPASNPIHAALNLQSLRESTVPETELAGQVLSGLADLRVELQNLAQKLESPRTADATQWSLSDKPYTGRPFRIGDRVCHATFGEGLVTDVSADSGPLIVVVQLSSGIKKRLLPGVAAMWHVADDA
jgi:hypothetical protein